MIRIKRAYEKAEASDGERILVERLWPRGIAKGRAAVDLWLKEVSPSTELRKWFAHDPAKWERFVRQYWAELDGQKEAVALLLRKSARGRVTLIYAARDTEHNGALALKKYLDRKGPRRRRRRPEKQRAPARVVPAVAKARAGRRSATAAQ